MADAYYVKASLYRFGAEARNEIISHFDARIRNCAALCRYDAVNHMFEVRCPRAIGDLADEAVGDIIDRYIHQELAAAERDLREPRIQRFEESLDADFAIHIHRSPAMTITQQSTSRTGSEPQRVVWKPLNKETELLATFHADTLAAVSRVTSCALTVDVERRCIVLQGEENASQRRALSKLTKLERNAHHQPIEAQNVISENGSTATYQLVAVRKLPARLLERTLVPPSSSARLERMLLHMNTLQTVRWDAAQSDYVLIGHTGQAIEATTGASSAWDALGLIVFSIRPEIEQYVRSPSPAETDTANTWKFKGQVPTVEQWVSGMGETELEAPDARPVKPSDALEKMPSTSKLAPSRLRVPRGSAVLPNEREDDKAIDSAGTNAKAKTDFSKLIGHHAGDSSPSKSGDDGTSSASSDDTVRQSDFLTLMQAKEDKKPQPASSEPVFSKCKARSIVPMNSLQISGPQPTPDSAANAISAAVEPVGQNPKLATRSVAATPQTGSAPSNNTAKDALPPHLRIKMQKQNLSPPAQQPHGKLPLPSSTTQAVLKDAGNSFTALSSQKALPPHLAIKNRKQVNSPPAQQPHGKLPPPPSTSQAVVKDAGNSFGIPSGQKPLPPHLRIRNREQVVSPPAQQPQGKLPSVPPHAQAVVKVAGSSSANPFRQVSSQTLRAPETTRSAAVPAKSTTVLAKAPRPSSEAVEVHKHPEKIMSYHETQFNTEPRAFDPVGAPVSNGSAPVTGSAALPLPGLNSPPGLWPRPGSWNSQPVSNEAQQSSDTSPSPVNASQSASGIDLDPSETRVVPTEPKAMRTNGIQAKSRGTNRNQIKAAKPDLPLPDFLRRLGATEKMRADAKRPEPKADRQLTAGRSVLHAGQTASKQAAAMGSGGTLNGSKERTPFINLVEYILDRARGCNGPLSAEIHFGQIVLPPSTEMKEYHRTVFTAETLVAKYAEQREAKKDIRTTFLGSLTSSAVDAAHIIDLVSRNGDRFFTAEGKAGTVVYEVHAYDAEGERFTIDVNQDGTYVVKHHHGRIGSINLFHPDNVWDAKFELTSTRVDKTSSTAAAEHFASSIEVKLPALSAAPEMYAECLSKEFSVDQVVLRRTVVRWSCEMPHVTLHVAECRDLTIESKISSPGIKAYAPPPNDMPEQGTLWYEAKLVVDPPPQWSENEGLEIGDDASWMPEDVLALFVGLDKLTTEMVKRMDGVGFNNSGPWTAAAAANVVERAKQRKANAAGSTASYW